MKPAVKSELLLIVFVLLISVPAMGESPSQESLYDNPTVSNDSWGKPPVAAYCGATVLISQACRLADRKLPLDCPAGIYCGGFCLAAAAASMCDYDPEVIAECEEEIEFGSCAEPSLEFDPLSDHDIFIQF